MVKKQATIKQKTSSAGQASGVSRKSSVKETTAKKRNTASKKTVKKQGKPTIFMEDLSADTIIVADEQLLEHAEFNNYVTETQARIIRRVEQKKRIDAWHDNGLISDVQQNNLYQLIGIPVAYSQPAVFQPEESVYQETVSNDFPEYMTQSYDSSEPIDMGLWVRRISLFAVGCIVLGLIAMIAANWQHISDTTKLLGYFGIFVGLLTSLFAVDSINHKWGKECLLWSNIGWIFAGIGLIGQIYHLSGTFWNALLYGSVLATPFILSSTLSVSLMIWAAAYCMGAVCGISDSMAPLGVMAILPVVLWKKENGVVSLFWWIALIASFVKLEWFWETLDVLFEQTMPVTFAGILVLFLLAIVGFCRRYVGAQTAFTQIIQAIFILSTACLTLMIDVAYTSGEVIRIGRRMSDLRALWSLVYLFGGAFAALVMTILCLPKNTWSVAVRTLAGFVLIAFVYNFLTASVFGFIFTLIWLLTVSVVAVHRKLLSLFNVCLFLMVVRILIAYITVLLSLESIGFALVSFGFVLLACIGAYAKGYPMVRQLIERREAADE